jgi:hypothetical protein
MALPPDGILAEHAALFVRQIGPADFLPGDIEVFGDLFLYRHLYVAWVS